MNQELAERVSSGKPNDPFEQVFWYIDNVNFRRSCYWPPHHLETHVRDLANHVEELYTDWLKARNLQGEDQELSQYLVLVLPYISFRFMNARGYGEVDMFKVSAAKKKQFLDVMFEEHLGIPDNLLTRAMINEAFKTLLSFISSIQYRREQ
jgi:hypothetical protein